MTSAIVLLSGGLDSATAASVARSEGFQVHCLTVDYGQRHRVELAAAARVARYLGASEHLVVAADLSAIGGSALTSSEIDVPHGRDIESLATAGVPDTYVPARNTILLALALALAEVRGASDIFTGMNAVDYSGYPDCRPEFVKAFEALANVATRMSAEEGGRFRIHTPLMDMGKADIIRLGGRLGMDYGLTWSCYSPNASGFPCGRCDSCQIRARGFREAGLSDPGWRG